MSEASYQELTAQLEAYPSPPVALPSLIYWRARGFIDKLIHDNGFDGHDRFERKDRYLGNTDSLRQYLLDSWRNGWDIREIIKEVYVDSSPARSYPLMKKEIVPVHVSFRKMFQVGTPDPELQVGDYLWTGKDEPIGVILEITTCEHLDGSVYVVLTPSAELQHIHYSSLAADKAKTQPQKEAVPVQEGVPNGFYSNKYLISINKAHLAVKQKNATIKLPCWKEGCDKPLIVCGYPFYICDNDHALNVETGERWLWKGTDQEYHGILTVLQGRVEPTYQQLFFPSSKKRTDTEANRISTHLSQIGEHLFDLLAVQVEDTYHWGRNTHQHHAGLRFAVNMMNKAILDRKSLVFPSETAEDLSPSSDYELWNQCYDYDAKAFLTQHGEGEILKMLLSIEETKQNLPKRTLQQSLF